MTAAETSLKNFQTDIDKWMAENVPKNPGFLLPLTFWKSAPNSNSISCANGSTNFGVRASWVCTGQPSTAVKALILRIKVSLTRRCQPQRAHHLQYHWS